MAILPVRFPIIRVLVVTLVVSRNVPQRAMISYINVHACDLPPKRIPLPPGGIL
jgi:hypothetical protein